jgi:hypothetical protein
MKSNTFNPSSAVDLSIIKELFEVKERKSYNSFTKDSPDELKPNRQATKTAN